jgi:hypothetical protein
MEAHAAKSGAMPHCWKTIGYSTRMAIAAYGWDGQSLTKRWFHDSSRSGKGGYGQGNHNLAAGDIDGAGRVLPKRPQTEHHLASSSTWPWDASRPRSEG